MPTLTKLSIRTLVLATLVVSGCAGPPEIWPQDIVQLSFHTVSEPVSVYPRTRSAFLVGSVLAHEENAVLLGANVRTSNGAARTTTDSLGQFRLALPPGKHVIEVQYVGFNGVTTDSLSFPASSVRESRFELGSVIIVE